MPDEIVQDASHRIEHTHETGIRRTSQLPVRKTGEQVQVRSAAQIRAEEQKNREDQARLDERERQHFAHKHIDENVQQVKMKQTVREPEGATTTAEFRDISKKNAGKEPFKPMMTFGQATKEKLKHIPAAVKQRVSEGSLNLANEFAGPVRTIQQGRSIRRQQGQRQEAKQERYANPEDTLLPTPKRPSRQQQTGAGFLFTEGFFNPKKGGILFNAQQGHRGDRKRKRDGEGPGDLLI